MQINLGQYITFPERYQMKQLLANFKLQIQIFNRNSVGI
uniref:Uncharacterized protein n=1 Tax=Myoviridae sp. ctBtT5 TaxID=2825048 RepID=A0A8S5PYU5_9CAUD|nr:MAG TPA: hypothetical protein [Myoviridae sp. ctBtT5]